MSPATVKVKKEIPWGPAFFRGPNFFSYIGVAKIQGSKRQDKNSRGDSQAALKLT